MGLGFNLYVTPPWDRSVPILEGKGSGKGVEHGMKEQECKELELTWS